MYSTGRVRVSWLRSKLTQNQCLFSVTWEILDVEMEDGRQSWRLTATRYSGTSIKRTTFICMAASGQSPVIIVCYTLWLRPLLPSLHGWFSFDLYIYQMAGKIWSWTFKEWKFGNINVSLEVVNAIDRIITIISLFVLHFRWNMAPPQPARTLTHPGNGISSRIPGTRGSSSMVFTTDVKEEI